MTSEDQLKELVRHKYSEIALQDKETNQSSCCGSGCCTLETTNIMNDDYTHLAGHQPDADLGLGCGLPTQFAAIKKGDTVVDLGSGAGNDCFVARAQTGETGKVIGIDFTPAMIEKATGNAQKLGFSNVEFREADIENISIAAGAADVVISNCVLNLVPNKKNVFNEIFRILKPGGHFSIADVVLDGDLPDGLKKAAEMYAGCISGAVQKQDYLALIHETGFKNIHIQKEKPVIIPDDILKNYLTASSILNFKTSKTGIFSITVYAEKPADCCQPGCCN